MVDIVERESLPWEFLHDFFFRSLSWWGQRSYSWRELEPLSRYHGATYSEKQCKSGRTPTSSRLFARSKTLKRNLVAKNYMFATNLIGNLRALLWAKEFFQSNAELNCFFSTSVLLIKTVTFDPPPLLPPTVSDRKNGQLSHPEFGPTSVSVVK